MNTPFISFDHFSTGLLMFLELIFRSIFISRYLAFMTWVRNIFGFGCWLCLQCFLPCRYFCFYMVGLDFYCMPSGFWTVVGKACCSPPLQRNFPIFVSRIFMIFLNMWILDPSGIYCGSCQGMDSALLFLDSHQSAPHSLLIMPLFPLAQRAQVEAGAAWKGGKGIESRP